jgi:acyl-[acyl-carrier-protein]-phospholipid O-acyltransferase/long-chain-fatty-acid--[acyl-carrier-protein] ligase
LTHPNDPSPSDRTLFEALLDARAKYGAKKPILEDQDRNPLSYTDLVRAASGWA